MNKQLGTASINQDVYIIIPHRFVNVFQGQKLLAYSLIYNMCKNSESQSFYASNNYLATRIGCNIPSANRIMKELTEQGWLIKSESVNSSGSYSYTLGKGIDDEGKEIVTEPEFVDFDDYKIPEKPVETKLEQKKEKDKTKSKSQKVIKEYIDSLSYSQELKDCLLKWYYAVAVGKIQLNILQEKIHDIDVKCNSNEECIKESIHKSILCGWFGFYPQKQEDNKSNMQYWETNKETYEKSDEVF